jgi:opacity protein-like surface antigen
MKGFISVISGAIILIAAAGASGQTTAESIPTTPIRLALYDPAEGIGEERAPMLLEPDPVQGQGVAGFSIGPMGGYLRSQGADRGTWFGGVQARLFLLRVLAVEGSISFHSERFANDDIIVTQYPVQVTGLLLPFPDWPVQPYGLAGAGWYYTRVDFRDTLASIPDETEKDFGWHVGAGAELAPSRTIRLFADVRYIFIDQDVDTADSHDFDYWQITFGLGFGF